MTIDFQTMTQIPTAEPTRAAAVGRLESWLERVGDYAEARNYDLPGHPNVSGLGPYVAHRLLTEREVVQRVLDVYPLARVRKFVEEVLWRTYWKGWLEMRPTVWTAYREAVETAPGGFSGHEHSAYAQAIAGETGIAAFDVWVRELVTTGYLHNHARMWLASIWVFTLRLPWELGADFFLRHLLDGDVASNTLSWRWVAGLQTPGKCYAATAHNIEKFTDGRFSPVGLLNERPEALIETVQFERRGLARAHSAAESILPDLSESPAGLLIFPEDLTPEYSLLGEAPFHSILAVDSPALALADQPSAGVARFRRLATQDAAQRAAAHWDGALRGIEALDERPESSHYGDHVGVNSRMRVYCGESSDVVATVVAWARREHLRTVRVLGPTVGPWKDRFEEIQAGLKRAGVSLRWYRRSWDEVHWPEARGGFFSFRKGIEGRLEELGVRYR